MKALIEMDSTIKTDNRGPARDNALLALLEILPTGWELNHNATQLLFRAVGHEQISTVKKDTNANFDELGYAVSGKAKMMGGSESFVVLRHPAMPNHKIYFNSKPYVRGGEKLNQFSIEIQAQY